jgi:hypothetical protein
MSSADTFDPFETDWRACLEAHLRYVITTGDTINEVSLIGVLKDSGFTDEDVQRVRSEITGETAEPELTEDEIAVEPVTEAPVISIVAEAPPPNIAPIEAGVAPEPEVEDMPLEPVAIVVEPEAMPVEAMIEPSAVVEEISAKEEKDPEAPPPMQLSLF